MQAKRPDCLQNGRRLANRSMWLFVPKLAAYWRTGVNGCLLPNRPQICKQESAAVCSQIGRKLANSSPWLSSPKLAADLQTGIHAVCSQVGRRFAARGTATNVRPISSHKPQAPTCCVILLVHMGCLGINASASHVCPCLPLRSHHLRLCPSLMYSNISHSIRSL